MDSISVKAARQQFAQLIDSAKRGQTTTIQRRGKAVACIAPPATAPKRGLPDLSAFRAGLGKTPRKATAAIRTLRERERS